ncbi:MAG: hypothetical protein PVJ30_01365 [Thiohalocapsa sp.]|jgi:hypothetical protein
MTETIVVHQLLLFVHLVVFALAISEVLRGDLGLLSCRTFDPDWLHRISRRILILLALLWITGAMLLATSVNTNPSVLLTNPKLATKVLVVTVLTLNGLLLHSIAFPKMLQGARVAALASILGAISTGSWLYASFVGVSRVIAPEMTFLLYLGLYAVAVSGGVTIALIFVRPHVQQMLRARAAQSHVVAPGRLGAPRMLSSAPEFTTQHPLIRRPIPGMIALSIGALLLGTLLSGLPMGR